MLLLPLPVRASGRSPAIQLLVVLTALAVAPAAHAWWFGSGTDWPEVTPEETALVAPRIDPEAGAEILFRSISIDDSSDTGTTYEYFRRIKVFDARGVEELKQIELDSFDDQKVTRVYARIIRPDGSIEELEKDAMHRREILKVGGFAANRTSFALPGLTPGSIVDYKWTIKAYGSAYGYRLFTQMNLPTHRLNYRMRFYPYMTGGWTSRLIPKGALSQGKDGWYELSLHDVPASVSEPFAPPASATEPWLLVYYTSSDIKGNSVEGFWKDRAQRLARLATSSFAAKNRSIRTKAAELLEGITDPVGQLRRLYDFCHRDIENIYLEASAYSAREVDKMRTARSAPDVLKFGYGSAYYINALFASLAGAAGFDVRLALCSNRFDSIFTAEMTYDSSMPDIFIAIKLEAETEWRFFNPGASYLCFGQLEPRNERSVALIGDSGKVEFPITSALPPEQSVMTRRARLTLEPNSDLVGEAEFSYTGQLATVTKRRFDTMTDPERLEAFKAEMADQIGMTEISELEMINATDPDEPVMVRFKLRAPGYADRTAQRLFFEPVVFEHESTPTFTREERESFLHFPFLWTEIDELTIQLPSGWELEEASAPAGQVDQKFLGYNVTFRVARRDHQLLVDRRFHLGTIALPKEAYPMTKRLFDGITEQDHHLLTLRMAQPEGADAVAPDQSP